MRCNRILLVTQCASDASDRHDRLLLKDFRRPKSCWLTGKNERRLFLTVCYVGRFPLALLYYCETGCSPGKKRWQCGHKKTRKTNVFQVHITFPNQSSKNCIYFLLCHAIAYHFNSGVQDGCREECVKTMLISAHVPCSVTQNLCRHV